MIAVTAVFTTCLLAQSPLSAESLRADVALLKRAMTTLHPGLNRYQTPAQVEEGFSRLEGRLGKGASLREAYLAFSEWANTIRCGHTYTNFFNQSEAVATAVFDGDNKVPFHFVWLGEKMVVTEDLTTERVVPKGAIVTAINGHDTAVILRSLMKIARADGGNDAKRRSYLGVGGNSRFEAFDIFFPLYFPVESKRLALDVRIGGKSKRIETDAMSMRDRIRRFERRSALEAGDGNPWRVKKLTSDTAYFEMGTWALFNSKWNWRGYIEERFRQLETEKVANLIVDLRGNEGGLSIGDELIARLIDKPLEPLKSAAFVRYRKTPADLIPHLNTWDRSFDDRTRTTGEAPELVEQAGANLFRLGAGASGANRPIQPKAPRFRGKVVVLVDASNSSATFVFAQMVKANRLGTLIGQTTGGNLRGINGGNFYFLTLPNSGIEIDLPLVAGVPSVPQPDSGLKPDIEVSLTPADIASGRDVVLERALREVARRPTSAPGPNDWGEIR